MRFISWYEDRSQGLINSDDRGLTMIRGRSDSIYAICSRGDACLLIVVLLIGIFYMLTLRGGHTWGDDFAQYIYHARNIAEGRPYHETGYVRNILNFIGPVAYPPLTSIVLAPVWYFFQLDLTAMKLVLIAVFCAALIAVGAAMRGRLPDRYRIVLLLLLALNPYLWEMKDNIQSEYLYTLVSFLSLIVMDLYYTGGKGSRSVAGALAIGVSIYLAWATREIGIVLLPTLLVYELWNRRKLSRYFFIAIGVFAVLALLQHQVLEPANAIDSPNPELQKLIGEMHAYDEGHIGIINHGLPGISLQVRRYLEAIKDFWSPHHVLALFLFAVCSLLAVAGFVRQLAGGVTVFEVYTAGYCAVILLFGGYQGIRYLVPIIPLYLMYVMHGIHWVERIGARRLSTVLLSSILCAAAIVYLDSYRKENFDVIEHGIDSPEARELFSFIRDNTRADSLIVFRKPRALYLLTGRRSVVYPDNQGRLYVVNEYVRAIHADYVITSGLDTDREVVIPALALQPDAYQPVFQNRDFTVYRCTGAGE